MKGTLLVQVLLSNGLYKVEHKSMVATVNTARKPFMLDELHYRMGHISPQATWKLVQDGTIARLNIDMFIQPGFCMACAQAKPTHKPVLQKLEGPQATKFGEKNHSDI